MPRFHRWRKVRVPPLERRDVDEVLELMEMEGERDVMEVEKESVIAEYYDLKEKIAVYEQDMKDVMNHPNYCLPFMQPGRLVRIRNDKTLFDWGVVITYNKRLKPIVLSLFRPILQSESRRGILTPREFHCRCRIVVRCIIRGIQEWPSNKAQRFRRTSTWSRWYQCEGRTNGGCSCHHGYNRCS